MPSSVPPPESGKYRSLPGLVADALSLHEALAVLETHAPDHRLLEVWRDGEYHYDLVFAVSDFFLVVAANCNGGVKEALLLDARPGRDLIRCVRRDGPLRALTVLSHERTVHFVPPDETDAQVA